MHFWCNHISVQSLFGTNTNKFKITTTFCHCSSFCSIFVLLNNQNEKNNKDTNLEDWKWNQFPMALTGLLRYFVAILFYFHDQLLWVHHCPSAELNLHETSWKNQFKKYWNNYGLKDCTLRIKSLNSIILYYYYFQRWILCPKNPIAINFSLKASA